AASAIQARELTDRLALQEAEWLRPWVRQNIQRLFPALLEQRVGPPMDVFLVHDARLQVSAAALVPRAHDEIRVSDIQAVFKGFTPYNDGWGAVDRRALTGIVGDNVRVIRVHHEPSTRDLSALQAHPEMVVLPWVRQALDAPG